MKIKQILLLGLVVLLSACSQRPLNVSLDEMSVQVDRSIVDSGEIKIQITNNGTVDHQVVIIKTETAGEKLANDPVLAHSASEEGSVGKIENIQAGSSAELVLDLSPGNYVIICNKPGHYMAGMYTEFTVK